MDGTACAGFIASKAVKIGLARREPDVHFQQIGESVGRLLALLAKLEATAMRWNSQKQVSTFLPHNALSHGKRKAE